MRLIASQTEMESGVCNVCLANLETGKSEASVGEC